MSLAESLQFTLFAAIGLAATTYVYLTVRGIIMWRKLGLRYGFVLAVTCWITFPYFLLVLWDYSIYQIVYIACSLAATLVFLIFFPMNQARENSAAQLIKKLPLKNRLLCIYPKDLLAGELPPPVTPAPWPARRIGMAFLLIAALLNVAMGVPRLVSSPSPEMPIFELAFLGSPFSQVLYGAFLLVATVLVYRKALVAGGLIGIAFGALAVLNGLFNVLGGFIGITGGILALADRREQKRTSAPK